MSATQENPVEFGDDLPPGTILGRGRYRIDAALCNGGFGIVYRAHNGNGNAFAIKEFFVEGFSYRSPEGFVLSPSDYSEEIAELLTLFSEEGWWPSLLNHPNVMRVIDYFEENETGYIVLEYIEGADLQDIMEHYPDWLESDQIVAIANALSDGLCYMHKNGVVHGDISPDNVMMRGANDPVLIDFGSSVFNDDNKPMNRAPAKFRAIKEGYSPPELYDRRVYPTPASDIYSFGATLHHMVTGKAPESGKNGLNRATLETELSQHSGQYDHRFLRAISSALSRRQEDRPTAITFAEICLGVTA